VKIKLTNGRDAAQDDIAALQRIVGRPLSPDVLEFVSGGDGAEPETNIFKIGDKNESGVNGFIPVKKIAEEIQTINDLPNGSYPIAWAEGGNYIIVNEMEAGAVFFWEHEKIDCMVRLASNFRSFLDMLEPFDVSSIKLKPGQVKKAWIDPDFLKDSLNQVER
jgi:hypothetical protein